MNNIHSVIANAGVEDQRKVKGKQPEEIEASLLREMT